MRFRRLLSILLISALLCALPARADGIAFIPRQLTAIESEAFIGVEFPDGIFLPPAVSSIAYDAFSPLPGVIYGLADSYAASYAEAVGARFQALAMTPRLSTVYLNTGMSVSALPIVALTPAAPRLWTLSWESSAPECVAVSESGMLTAVSKGSAVITVSSALGLEARFMVTVVASGTVIKEQYVSPTYLVLKRGETATLTASCSSASSQYKSGTWYSDNPAVVSVPESTQGTVTVTAVGVGTANVCVLSSSGVVAKCAVVVNPVVISSLSLDREELTLNPGESAPLTATFTPADADCEIEWESTSPEVASVSRSGIVYAHKGGFAIISASTPDGVVAECSVRVPFTLMTEATLAETAVSGIAGETFPLTYSFAPENATPARFIWWSDDPEIAAVHAATGEITFVSAGTTTVRGDATDGSGLTLECEVTVSEIPVESFELDYFLLSLNAGETQLITGTVAPENASHRRMRFEVEDPSVAMVDENGLIYALSAGSTAISVSVGHGDYAVTRVLELTVMDEDPVDYRLLIINEYSDPGSTDFLPFSANSTLGVKDAFARSEINGSKYDITFVANPSRSAFRAAVTNLSTQADANDVTVVYILTHGNRGSGYTMSLPGGSKVLGSELLSDLKTISGHVVLLLCTCYSGHILGVGSGCAYQGKNGPGSLSILCSATDTKSCYYDTTDTSASYDFFSYALTRGLSWNMVEDSALETCPADGNHDGSVTLSELSSYCRVNTQRYISSYIQLHGVKGLNGNPNQFPTWSFAPGEGDLVIYSVPKM